MTEKASSRTMTEALEQRVLLFLPFGKDGELACQVLEGIGLGCMVCKSIPELMREIEAGVGVLLSVEEALPESAIKLIGENFAGQPTWSDLPVLVLTKSGSDTPWLRNAYERLGNLTLLERPVRTSTLLSAVRSALRARNRQYEIRAADQRKDEFLAMLAHELRNPLAPISAAADLLGMIASDAERVTQTGEIISRQVSHMTNLIDDLLDVARVTRGLVSYQKEPLDMRQILTEAVEQVNPLIAIRRHHLSLHLPPDPALVLADRKRLVQVVANLLGNASKYTPEGGSIALRLQVSPDEVSLEVSDNGIGMASGMVSRVFDLFTQAERTPDRSQGGLGLGLALVKNLVTAHEGTVHACSPGLGKGSTFTARLPCLKTQSFLREVQADGQAENNAFVQGMRVMVVDDNVDAANVLKMFLDATGHQVYIEHAAANGIECARRTSPHVCLLDIGLPDMDGHELARHLREIPQTADSLLIAVTGYGQDRDREKSMAAGFDHHFVKPVDIAKLAKILSRIEKD
jgi:signal transduction histidine kinase/ActR/RegA family two-component response regulator